uniref:Uncharacterized protein n=2 Tax=unclassified Caudoviricetes TaxID=2788787 RepID=A0A8S5PT75_9CAUD|nr:MAG TPA: hypothetical protein [Siphoviridae sp. ctPxx43]DAE10270.1 MAG TPA: hypothetical protein [Siphoviridae sp. ct0yh16]
MLIKHSFNFLFCRQVLAVGIQFDMDFIDFVIDPAVSGEVVTVRNQITNKRRIRAFSLCKMVIRKGKSDFFKNCCYFLHCLSSQCLFHLGLQGLHRFFFGRRNMRSCGNSTTAALGMTMLQKVGDLIAVFGMHYHIQRTGGFLYRFDRPALCIFAGVLWSSLRNFILYRFTRLLYRFFQIISCKVCIFLQAFHNGRCHAGNRDSV